MSQKIHFFVEEIEFTLKSKMKLRKWIQATLENEDFFLGELNFIFCSDSYLLKINQEYLNHDTFTDIITFDNSEKSKEISGDIFISIDRVVENASTFSLEFKDELHRVMIHGILHLMGYSDKNKEEKYLMTEKENEYLAQRWK
ncbi:rRNA maturation RNase YbeY [Albibacterium indicum]|uniref:rRNA maturation RNase YbeY n=1 Tax=Albibacterium indicum TaxID=2292082 RepID=UPI000E54FF03|nr:rRNA maturation RNase YbeY [Pedobacter indicus]